MADKKERDIVKELALCALAVVALFWGYKAAADVIEERREAKTRAVLEASLFDAQKIHGANRFGRFAYYDDEFFGSCLEFTTLGRSQRTVRYGAAQLRDGRVVQVHRSFEECSARGAG